SGHRGPILALSRRGLLPHVHAATAPYPDFLGISPAPATVLGLLRRIRAEIEHAALDGTGWRSVFDAMRPPVPRLWQTLPPPARWLINCSGPQSDFARIREPLIRHLLETGTARPDSLRLGLEIGANLALVRRDGTPSRRLFALGPPTRGTFWEITAAPDIRNQCRTFASCLVPTLPALAPPLPAYAAPGGPGLAGMEEGALDEILRRRLDGVERGDHPAHHPQPPRFVARRQRFGLGRDVQHDGARLEQLDGLVPIGRHLAEGVPCPIA